MRAATDEEIRLMDSILRDLTVKNKSTMDFEAIHPSRKNEVEVCLQELLSMEMIKMFAEDGGGTFRITTEGKRFIATNSFEKQAKEAKEAAESEQKQKEEVEKRTSAEFGWKRTDEKRKNLTIALTVITVCCTLYNIYIQVSNSKKAEAAQLSIDSVKKSLTITNQRIDSLVKAQNPVAFPAPKPADQKR